MTKSLACAGCDREIPAGALWAALASRTRLKCSGCGTVVTQGHLYSLVGEVPYVKVVVAAYAQLVRYGWTSADALVNAGIDIDPKVLGGYLGGWQRAGLIQRADPVPAIECLDVVNPRPIFVPGVRFPAQKSKVSG